MVRFINKNRIAIIQAGTQMIEANAFDRCISLECVVIPRGVSKIEDYAFNHCTSLTTVILPFSVTEIGEYSFDGCAKLATIYVPADMVEPVRNKLLSMGLHVKIVRRDMDWDEAIRKVLAKKGSPMRAGEIVKEIIEQGYRIDYGNTPDGTVRTVSSINERGWFKIETRGLINLVGTSAPTPHSHKAVGGKIPVAVRPCALYSSDDSAYKKASSFIDSPVPSQDEKDLLELIVNFQLGLVGEAVCFADILNDLEVVFSDEDKKRDQDIDKDLLEEKLNELKKKIKKIERKAKQDQKDEALLAHMKSAAKTAQDLLDKASGDKVKFKVLRLGEFIPPKGDGLDKPKVVIYYKNIESFCEENYSERLEVMAGVFIHEMFHAWNYSKAGRKGAVLAIDEPMVEFETLYFLEELKAFKSSIPHHLYTKVLCVSIEYGRIVHDKQQSIGDVAAYGFGYYLFKNLSDNESKEWIETYSEKSAYINDGDKSVEKAKSVLIPIYPFRSDSKAEADVLKLFEKIIFNKRAIPATAEELDETITGSHVSLRDLVLACIETIGRKCFDVQELYAFAPIFKACMPHCSDLEEALKQQLDELVKDRILEDLAHDCYCVKLD